MARGALKMARERLVANVKGGQFGPRAIFFDLHPPPPGQELVWRQFGEFSDSRQPTNGPPSFGNFWPTVFFGPRPKVFEKHWHTHFGLPAPPMRVCYNV